MAPIHGMKTELWHKGQIMQMRFRYLVEDVDRYGNVRLYVRVPGRRKVRLRAKFGTDEFLAAYTAAVDGHLQAPRQAPVAKRGSFRHLCIQYYASATYDALDRATQSWRRRALDSICVKHADKPAALMLSRHVRQLRDELKNSPGAANQRLKALKALFAWACEDEPELAPQNPTLGVKKIKYATRGHHSWDAEEIEQFRARHPIESKARLALDLLLYTGGRREDAVRLGPQHARNGRVRFTRRRTSTDPRLRSTFLCIQGSAPPLRRHAQYTSHSWLPSTGSLTPPRDSAMPCVIGVTRRTCIIVRLTDCAKPARLRSPRRGLQRTRSPQSLATRALRRS